MMSEVVFSVLEVIDQQAEKNEFDMSVFLVNIAEAIQDGFKKAVQKYEDLFVRGKMILPPHGKEFFHAAVSSFLHPSVRTFLHTR
jgi:hypothetical protein